MAAKARAIAIPEGDAAALNELWKAWAELREQCRTIATDHAGLQRNMETLAAQVKDTRAQLDAVTGSLQNAAQSLTHLARTMEEARDQETRHQTQTAEALRAHLEHQQTLSVSVRGWQEQTRLQLTALVAAERDLEERLCADATVLAGTLRELGERTAEGLQRGAEAMERLSVIEVRGTETAGTFEAQARQSEAGLSEALRVVGDAASHLVQHAGDLLEEQQRLQRAEGLKEALRANRLGLKSLSDGKYLEAIASFEKARALAPDAPEPRFNMSLAHYHRKHFDVAFEEARQLAETFPERAEFQFLCGLVRLGKGDFEGARRDLGMIVGRTLNDHNVQAATGVAHLLCSDPAVAVEAFRRAVKGDGQIASVLRNVGFQPKPVAKPAPSLP